MENLARNYEQEFPAVLPKEHLRADDLESLAHDLRNSVDASGVAIVKEESEDPETLVCIVSVGPCVPPVGARLNPNSGISGRCIRERRSQRSYDTRTDPRVDRAVSERLGIRSLAVVPLVAGSRCIGLIEAVSDRIGHFDQDKLLAIEQAACSAALLLGTHQPVTEQPILLSSPASEQTPACVESKEPPIPELFRRDEEPRPKEQSWAESTPASEAATVPNLFEAKDSASPYQSLRWSVIGALATLAIVTGILISAARFPKHLSASTHTSDSGSALSPSQARASVSGRISPNVPQTSPVRTNDQISASQLLAQRAAHGDVAAQVDLAASYLKGENLPADSAKAASWYIVAGENGNAEAKRRSVAITRRMAPFEIAAIRFNLGKMYMNGVGVDQNYVSAYTWFELAKAAGDIRAEGQENTLEEKMSEDQVKQAKQRASQWLESHSTKSTSLAKR